jgi:signal transduction histidine kinase
MSEAAELAEMTGELAKLDDQVKLLVKTERRLHSAQRVIEDQLGQFRALNELALRIGRARDPRSILEASLDTLLGVLQVDQGVGFLSAGPGWVEAVAVKTQPGLAAAAGRPWPLALHAPSLDRHVLARPGRRAVDEDTRVFLDRVAAFLGCDERAPAIEIVLPLAFKSKERLGIIALRKLEEAPSYHEHLVGEEDLPFLDLVASHTEAALENVHLYSQVSSAAHHLERKVAERTADLAQANEGLARSQSELGKALEFREQVIGILGHDLRSPLGAVRMCAQLLMRYEGLSDDVRRHVHRIENAGNRMAEMIGTLLDFTQSRFRANLPITPEPMDLHEVCRGAIEELLATNPGRAIHLHAEGDGQGEWDPARIAQLVANLGSNALTHGSPTDPVRVTVRAREAEVVLEVMNRGPAIAPELLPVLFEAFRRGPTTERGKRAGGLGLGLYIAQHIVDAHRGSIEVRSSEREGTLFRVRLPRR